MAALALLSSHALGDPVEGTPGPGVFGEWASTSTVDQASGAFRYSIPIEAPAPRGRAAVSLALTYDSNARDGEAGYGWSLKLPAIERRAMTGFPTYVDAQDRFTFSGQPLVYICDVGGACGETAPSTPAWAAGARCYRLQNETDFSQFYLLPSGDWRVQERDGNVLYFGAADTTAVPRAVDQDDAPAGPRIARWHLAEIEDVSHNKVYLNWIPRPYVAGVPPDKRRYLADVWDTPRADASGAPDFATFAHHIQLSWTPIFRPVNTFVHADRAPLQQRLKRIAVSSHRWSAAGNREILRIYRLSYLATRLDPLNTFAEAPLFGHSFLSMVEMEGRCAGNEEDGSGQVPGAAACGFKMPAQTFEYEPTQAGVRSTDRVSIPSHVANARQPSMTMFDVDRDGLPDIVRGWPDYAADGKTPTGLEALPASDLNTHHLFLNRGAHTSARVTFEGERCVHTAEILAMEPGIWVTTTEFTPNAPNFLSPHFGATYLGSWGDSPILWAQSTISLTSRLPHGGDFTIDTPLVGPFCEASSSWPATHMPGSGEKAYRWQEHRWKWNPPAPTAVGWILMGTARDPFFGEWGETNVDVDGDGYLDRLRGDNVFPIYELPIYALDATGALVHDLQYAQTAYTRKRVGTPAGPIGATGDPTFPANPWRRVLEPFASSTFEGGSVVPRAPLTGQCHDDGGCGPRDFKCVMEPPDAPGYCRSYFQYSYVDVNGDGLVDLVRFPRDASTDARVLVYPGDGRSWFGVDDQDPTHGGTYVPYAIEVAPSPLVYGAQESKFLHDINGDGLADLVTVNTGGVVPGSAAGSGVIRVWINTDGKHFACVDTATDCAYGAGAHSVALRDPWGPAPPENQLPSFSRVTFADVDANGVDEIVVLSNEGYWVFYFVEPSTRLAETDARAPRPGLLRQINGGNGAVTKIHLTTIQELDVDARAAVTFAPWTPDPGDLSGAMIWKTHSPVSVPVVSAVHTEREQACASPPCPVTPFDYSRTTHYRYRNPAYDPWERRFLGFRRTRVETDGVQGVTEYTHHFGRCAGPADGCADTSDDPSSPSNPLDPGYPDAPSGGELVQVDTFIPNMFVPAAGVDHVSGWLTSVHYSHARMVVATGHASDPRRVVFRPVTRTESRVFDPASPVVLQSVQDPNLGDTFPLLPIQSGSVTTKVLSTYDPLSGQIATRTELGRVSADGATCFDSQLRTTYTYQTWCYGVQPCVPSPIHVVQDGFEPGPCGLGPNLTSPKGLQRRTTFGYADPAHPDLPSWVQAHGEGGIALDRHHETSGRETAGAPFGQSVNGTDPMLRVLTYDAFGNLIREQGPNSACAETVYDAPYAHLPQVHKQYTGGCASDSIDTATTFDRGMGVVVATYAPNGGLSMTELDPFGRPKLSTREAPDGLGFLATDEFNYGDGGHAPYTHHKTFTGPDQYVEEYSIRNGIGEPMIHMRTGDTAEDRGWIVDRAVRRDQLGAVWWSESPYFTSAPPSAVYGTLGFPTHTTTEGPIWQTFFDAFHRVSRVQRATATFATYEYLPLLVKTFDPLGTATVTETDGFGRVTLRTRLVSDPITTLVDYLPTGEPERIRRLHGLGPDTYERTMSYDSLGRLVSSEEPNVGRNQYAWSDAGQLVGTADARGCGRNLIYDPMGRLVAEDFSPCKDHHPLYTPVSASSGTETYHWYDAYEAGQEALSAPGEFQDAPGLANGQLTAVYDRGGHTRMNRDVRGNLRRVTRRIARPPPAGGAAWEPSVDLSDRYTSHYFVKRADYDRAERPRMLETGLEAPAMMGPVDGKSRIFVDYSKRGAVGAVRSSYSGGPGADLLASQILQADGLPGEMTFGDLAATHAAVTYRTDSRRPAVCWVDRAAPALWSGPFSASYPSPAGAGTTQVALGETWYMYNAVDLPAAIWDLSDPGGAAWPAGASRVHRGITYDENYRTKRVDYSYAGSALQIQPFAPEVAADDHRPVPLKNIGDRVGFQAFEYDFLGNTTSATDDSSRRYDRSLGTITNSVNPSDANKKGNRLVSADGIAAAYDEAGNLVDLRVERPTGHCSPDLCAQRFAYESDEIGQLVRARRWDYDGTIPATEPVYPFVPATTPVADLRFAYHLGQRILKTREIDGGEQRHTVDVFDTLRLQDAKYDVVGLDYDRDEQHSTGYLMGLGRVVFQPGLPSPSGTPVHVFLSVGDYLGSTGILIDRETSEVVESATHQAFGALESDYRPARWGAFREDFKFTGKEEDIEVGIQYFGARYYAPRLGRWMSADPLTIHGLGADMNPYAYVGGRVMSSTDPFGLCTGEMCIGQPSGERMIREQMWKRAVPAQPSFAVAVASEIAENTTSTGGTNNPLHPNFTVAFKGKAVFKVGEVNRAYANAGIKTAVSNVLLGPAFNVSGLDRYIINQTSHLYTMPVGNIGSHSTVIGDVANHVVAAVAAAAAGGLGQAAARTAGIQSAAAAEGVAVSQGIRVTPKGMQLLEANVGRFEPWAPNQAMIDRLRSAMTAGERVTGADANFYLHEISEGTFRARGMGYDAAHAAALQKYGASQFSIYHPEVIQAFPTEFNNKWRAFWGLP